MKIDFKLEVKSDDKLDAQSLIDLIVKIRKIKDIKEFLDPPSPLDISLFDFDDRYRSTFKKVLAKLKEVKKQNQMVVVYTDYDADGITGGAILWETLHNLGFKVMPYVPDRKTEGYGFSIIGIDKVIRDYDPAMIISVDHGITKVDEVEYAKKKGIDVIITDHHLKGDSLPKAFGIFHIPLLSGSGVSYFFSKEVYSALNGRSSVDQSFFKSDYQALAAIGTIADLVPLTGPSRSIVKWGLESFGKVKRYGIKHILKQSGIEGKPITPYEVGFMIAPRINAIGRLHHAIDALRLLCTTSEKKAYDLSLKIGQTNTDRQQLVEKSVKEAKTMVAEKPKKIIILYSDHWHEGIIGLIASKITEAYYRPTIVLTKNDGFYKASARSIPAFNITEFLKSLRGHLVDVGGHTAAAGFTIEKGKLKKFIEMAEKKAEREIRDDDLEKVIMADVKIPLSKVNLTLARLLEGLSPYGIGNPRPVFLSDTILTGAQLFGKTNNHLKVFAGGVEFIAFNKAELFKELSRGTRVSIVYTIDVDRWSGRDRLRGMIVSITQ